MLTSTWPGYDALQTCTRKLTWKRKKVEELSEICYKSIKKAKVRDVNPENPLVDSLCDALLIGASKTLVTEHELDKRKLTLTSLEIDMSSFEGIQKGQYTIRKTMSLDLFEEYVSSRGLKWILDIRRFWARQILPNLQNTSTDVLQITKTRHAFKNAPICIVEHSACGGDLPMCILNKINPQRSIKIITSPALLSDRLALWGHANNALISSHAAEPNVLKTRSMRIISWIEFLDRRHAVNDILFLDEICTWPNDVLKCLKKIKCSYIFVGTWPQGFQTAAWKLQHMETWIPRLLKLRLKKNTFDHYPQSMKTLHYHRPIRQDAAMTETEIHRWFGRLVDQLYIAAHRQPNLLRSRWIALLYAWRYMHSREESLIDWSDRLMTALLRCLLAAIQNFEINIDVFDDLQQAHTIRMCESCNSWFGSCDSFRKHRCEGTSEYINSLKQTLIKSGSEEISSESVVRGSVINMQAQQSKLHIYEKVQASSEIKPNLIILSVALSMSISSIEGDAYRNEDNWLEQACRHKGLTLWLTNSTNLSEQVERMGGIWQSKTPYQISSSCVAPKITRLDPSSLDNLMAFRNIDRNLKNVVNIGHSINKIWFTHNMLIREYLGYNSTILSTMSCVWRWSMHNEFSAVYISPAFMQSQSLLANLRHMRRSWPRVPFIFQSAANAPWDCILHDFVCTYYQ